MFGLSDSGVGARGKALYRAAVRKHYAENSPESAEGRGEERLLHYELTRAILGAFYAVHTKLGAGFLEGVYANALAVMLRKAGMTVEREVPFEMFFEGVSVGRYRADMVVESKVIVEIKASLAIDDRHRAQLCNYLRVSGFDVGLLLNFSHRADFRRVVVTRK